MISWRDGDGSLHQGSLFATFAALARGEAWSFPALRPHQREPWHAFTVQVATLALIRAGSDELPADEAAWHDLLLGLTPGQPEAWELVVEDWSKPALLQPPVVAGGNKADYKSRLPTPDALDMLVTAKNHDVKQERIAQASEEDWLFAIVTLQTGEGYGGSGNHSISRMNGGLSNRMSLSVRPGSGGAAAAFRRDLDRLLAQAVARPERRSGLALLWTDPWDGTRSLDYSELDQLYVEICRRVRLVRTAHGIAGLGATSACQRVAGKELRGRTEDPWAPLKADGSESVTAAGNGFSYRTMTRLLKTGETKLPILANVHETDDAEGLSIVAAALVRGQGKTEGLHRRTIRTSRMKDIEDYGPAEEKALDRVGQVAHVRSAEAAAASGKLRYALLTLLQGAPSDSEQRLAVRLNDKSSGDRASNWIAIYDDRVDRTFFDNAFWKEAAGDMEPHRTRWRKQLQVIASGVLDDAAKDAPRTEMRRVRAIARARSVLDAQMAKWLKEVPDGE